MLAVGGVPNLDWQYYSDCDNSKLCGRQASDGSRLQQPWVAVRSTKKFRARGPGLGTRKSRSSKLHPNTPSHLSSKAAPKPNSHPDLLVSAEQRGSREGSVVAVAAGGPRRIALSWGVQETKLVDPLRDVHYVSVGLWDIRDT